MCKENGILRSKSVHMFRYNSQNQLTIEGFATPFGEGLHAHNRWIRLGELLPWDRLASIYSKAFTSNRGAPTVDARVVIGAMIIKHKMQLDDRGTIEMIQENPYMQYFLGLSGFQQEPIFDPSLFVHLRKRMGYEAFEEMTDVILREVEQSTTKKKDNSQDEEQGPDAAAHVPQSNDSQINTQCDAGEQLPNKGVLKVDATVCDQYIPFPTDLNLVSKAREISEGIIDEIWPYSDEERKPRTYRNKARRLYLNTAKSKRPGIRKLRKAIGQQLRFLKRNLGHIDKMLEKVPVEVLSERKQTQLVTIRQVYAQQYKMWKEKVNRCENRIVNIYQPYVRPIVRGKQGRKTEFGAKICASINEEGISRLETLSWEAYNEAGELPRIVENYKEYHGYYPEVVCGDQLYGTRDNREWCATRNIKLQAKPLGRPKKAKAGNKEAWYHRNDIEGKFGEGKNSLGMNKIRAKIASTSESWISALFLVMNLNALLRKHTLVLGMLWMILAFIGTTIAPCGNLHACLARIGHWSELLRDKMSSYITSWRDKSIWYYPSVPQLGLMTGRC